MSFTLDIKNSFDVSTNNSDQLFPNIDILYLGLVSNFHDTFDVHIKLYFGFSYFLSCLIVAIILFIVITLVIVENIVRR
jgi:hypothetical protein